MKLKIKKLLSLDNTLEKKQQKNLSRCKKRGIMEVAKKDLIFHHSYTFCSCHWCRQSHWAEKSIIYEWIIIQSALLLILSFSFISCNKLFFIWCCCCCCCLSLCLYGCINISQSIKWKGAFMWLLLFSLLYVGALPLEWLLKAFLCLRINELCYTFYVQHIKHNHWI